ncbi:MAG: VWA domain-containing protein [Gammaproteobacteria bacterium]|nr:VWA domain-containing protein [Gammaproteobacteria bacterium]
MISWQWPWMFALLPLPWLLRRLLPPASAVTQAVRVPFFDRLRQLQLRFGQRGGTQWRNVALAALCWCALLAAAARPVRIGDPVPLPQAGRDLMLAVDISVSMREQDMVIGNRAVARIDAVKAVVGDFIARRIGDRFGLILFGQQGYLQTPLTLDTRTVRQHLFEAQLGFAGNATAIGDAIGLAVKRLRQRPEQSRVLILLTDGANTAGTEPRQVADVAAAARIRIHTVVIGAAAPTDDFFGFARRARMASELDEATLRYIALATGGQYFRARDPRELAQIYRKLDELEPLPEQVVYRPEQSLFHWPLALALGGSVALFLLQWRGSARGPVAP